MSVRGTTAWQHARVQKRIINLDEGRNSTCAWDTCSNDSTSLYQFRQHEHVHSIACDSSLARHIWWAFCCERHMTYFVNATLNRGYGYERPRHVA